MSAEHASSTPQTQSSGLAVASGPSASGGTSQTNSNGQDTSQQVLATACISIVKDYRRSRTSKIEANVALIETISAELFSTPEQCVSTVAGPYLDMLNEVESEHACSGDNPTRQPRVRVDEPAHVNEEAPVPKDRSRAGSNEPGEPARKCPKLDYSSIKAAVRTRRYQPLSPSLKCTNEILKNWSQDQKEIQRYLMYHKYAPEFHKSGWAEIVAGECINLNVAHNHHYLFLSEAASRKITTDSDWSAAWNKAADSIKFSFPHQEAELNGYFSFISKYFSQSNPSAHGRVIRFDKAVRNRVGSSWRLKLTNFREFKDLIFSHFDSDGKQCNDTADSKSNSGGSYAGGSTGSNKRDPCRKWNTGFWPWADVPDDSYPSTNDNSMRTCQKTDDQLLFIEAQLQEEIRLGHVSESFGQDLLPGMYSVPMHTVPKPNSDKLQLVVDHTAGDYSLNLMINSDSIKGTNGLHPLGALLLQFHENNPNEELIMFKSDVSQAF
ncbi:hypothetical protein DFJ58DRAFT_734496 [Suillus subalutaceus]|uniref:uncharacterized protein n=1 Tax=Suillus subalutaceus TaxID=48586 RepID=UPI001B85FF53|nr:uncharacterized protein DFJ58DRAFT_734496 [Suillus subalutaceus]KAG1837226.1 hypothetical protein DFJ58DRAFT_734496 [Suillus subalutaceus]